MENSAGEAAVDCSTDQNDPSERRSCNPNFPTPILSMDQSAILSSPMSNSNPSTTLVLIISTDNFSKTQLLPLLTTFSIISKFGLSKEIRVLFGN